MPKLAFIGDSHGDLGAVQDCVDIAVKNGCVEVISVGDWGFIWPGEDRSKLNYLSDYMKASGVKLRFIDGNHDVHPVLFKLACDSKRTSADPEQDNCAPYIIYQHRGSLHQYDDGTRVVFLGGAPSIDYRGRLDGISWWKEEMITDAQMNAAGSHQGAKTDILVTHDTCLPPSGIKETSDMTFNYRAADVHSKIRWVADCLRPSLNVHGHYHHRYSGSYKGMRVEGLDCNMGSREDMIFVYEG